jgi:hypothetical protein
MSLDTNQIYSILQESFKDYNQNTQLTEIGKVVKWSKQFHDGRSYETWNYSGEIIRINPKTVTVVDSVGNIWRVEYKEIIF